MNDPTTTTTPAPCLPLPGWAVTVLGHLDDAAGALAGHREDAASEASLVYAARVLITARDDLDGPSALAGMTNRTVAARSLRGVLDDLEGVQERTVGEGLDAPPLPLPDWARDVLTHLDAAFLAAGGRLTVAERRVMNAAHLLLSSRYDVPPRDGHDVQGYGGWVARELVRAMAGYALDDLTRPPVPVPAVAATTLTALDAPVYPAPGAVIPDQPGYRVGECGHRVAGSEWAAGYRVCEHCPAGEWADDDLADDDDARGGVSS